MAKKITEDVARALLSRDFPNIELVKWGGLSSRVKSLFRDNDRSVEFSMSFSNLRCILRKNPNYTFSPTMEEASKKRSETCIKRYGVSHHAKLPEVQDKISATSVRKYGVKHALSSPNVKEKRRQTNLLRYGVENCFSLESSKEKIKKTSIKRYGVPNPRQSEEVSERIAKTNLERYGFAQPAKNKFVASKISKSKTRHYSNGASFAEISESTGVSYTTVLRAHNKGIVDLQSLEKRETLIEKKISQIIGDSEFVKNKHMKKYVPDFTLEKEKLIIECDGLYWHSDKVNKNKKYHKEKRDFYIKSGYFPLFFRSDEIDEKYEIVKSIIENKIGKSKRIYARKCKIQTIEKDEIYKRFFKENHLMGQGHGRVYSCMIDDLPVCMMQVKWKNKENRVLEVSRFCSLLGTVVVGGWSRLLSHVQKEESPLKVISFVDLRYGNGNSLEKSGFTKAREGLSFKWTDFRSVFNRSQYRGKTGYDYGLFKIWDCGQTRWEKGRP